MELKSVKRGTDVEDSKWFSDEALIKLKKANTEAKYLINRNYNMHSIIELVGNHYQFSSRQRMVLQRSLASDEDCKKRTEKLLDFNKAKDDFIYIDGFNLIISLEVALSGGILVLCSDGTIRDIAGLRGTYSIIDKTDEALTILGKEFNLLNIKKVKFFLDSGVSNSGRLKTFILEHAEKWGFPVDVYFPPNADPILSKLGRVVTADSAILDACSSWFNLSKKVIDDYIPQARILDLN